MDGVSAGHGWRRPIHGKCSRERRAASPSMESARVRRLFHVRHDVEVALVHLVDLFHLGVVEGRAEKFQRLDQAADLRGKGLQFNTGHEWKRSGVNERQATREERSGGEETVEASANFHEDPFVVRSAGLRLAASVVHGGKDNKRDWSAQQEKSEVIVREYLNF